MLVLSLMSHPPPLSYYLYNGLGSSTSSSPCERDGLRRHAHDVPGDTAYLQSQQSHKVCHPRPHSAFAIIVLVFIFFKGAL